jgi:MoaA/NifB/PqqE/SkfB family radical SAM enzyme
MVKIMSAGNDAQARLREPTDFGDREYPVAMVNVTNACNLECAHCFIFRDGNPVSARDKMDDETMLHQLRLLRDRHNIRYMYFMGGEPMIRKELVFEGMKLFEQCQIVTNGTYGIPSVPGHVVTVSLDGPQAANDVIRGEGVYDKVKAAIHDRDPSDGTDVIVQMVITRQNQAGIEDFFAEVAQWPISGVAISLYVPTQDDKSNLDWPDLGERDEVVRRVIALKQKYPALLKANLGALELMFADVAAKYTGERGENCPLVGQTLTLYMGDGGNFEQTFCCYGNNVDCSRCGSYLLFNAVHQQLEGRSKAPIRLAENT